MKKSKYNCEEKKDRYATFRDLTGQIILFNRIRMFFSAYTDSRKMFELLKLTNGRMYFSAFATN